MNFEGVDAFFKKYELDHCQTAKKRIISGQSGYTGEESDKGMGLRVMAITEKMIGTIDVLEINMKEVETLYPAVMDILGALNQYPNLSQNPSGNEIIQKITKWHNILK